MVLIEEEIDQMKNPELIDEIAQCHSMIKSNLCSSHAELNEHKKRLESLKKEALRRMA